MNAAQPTPAKLLYENGPNWQYATGTHIADPALWYQSPRGKTHIIVSELEIALMQKTANVDKIHGFAEVRKALGGKPLNLESMVSYLAAQETSPMQRILVPQDFPSYLFYKLKAADLPLHVSDAPLFFPARAIKTADEIKKLKAAQKLNESAFELAFGILAASRIDKTTNTLLWKGTKLTAEMLQGEMNAHLARGGATEFHGGPIVACGPQGAMPHARGSGPLKAHQFIVMDCFPRHANGYWGDLTRTVLKGKATEWHHKVYNAVLKSQKLALGQLHAGADGHIIHQSVIHSLEQDGFPTGTDKAGNPYGMFHGTGHSVGLELHDGGPRTISGSKCILEPGMITSVEPGLYYAEKSLTGGVGGCRIEDVVVINAPGAKSGYTNLTTLSKTDWIIR